MKIINHGKVEIAGKPRHDTTKEIREKQKPEEEIELPVIKPPGLQQPG